MANIFPKWTNELPVQLLVAAAVLLGTVVMGMAYYFTPKFTRVGYAPKQPVAFSHALHAGQLQMDCRYCHTSVEVSSHSSIPNNQTCMNCHQHIQTDSPLLATVRESWNSGKPIPWVRIHQAPDYVYFNHAVHVNRGVSCVECHGQVNQMEVVWHDQPQSMSWCLECHRNPEEFIRPVEHVYNLDWQPPQGVKQTDMGAQLVKEWNVNPPETCAGCHR